MRQATNIAVERVRGMNDIPPARHAVHATLAAQILDACTRAGYALMDFPVIESTELFLRKAGEERVQQMYAFRYRNRELCLRPEFTASVVRSIIGTMQSAPLPIRVAYHGPVFRYERPGQARYRQFTEVGIELLGAATASADAEVVGTAVTALRAQEPATMQPPDRDALLALLREAGISLDGHRRTPEEIAEGLIRKMARRAEGNDVRRALDFLRRLVMLRGTPAEVFPQLEALLADEHLGMDAVARLRSVIMLLGAYGIAPDQVILDLGLGRGLHYYTGVLFELYAAGAEQLGGGGRYDDLATILGSRQPLPAVGFSLGIERIADALPSVEHIAATPPTVVVGHGESGAVGDAAMLAQALRAVGWTALLDVRDRTPNAAIKHARSIRAAAYAEPSAGGSVVRWVPLNGERERHIPRKKEGEGLPKPDEPIGATSG
ncbi:MAG: histidine--tRNA ligase family protein [Thermomicrobia bacterium]|nr:histidine--tRNA ligase family protein [Thermomicrobia bacterium]